LDFDLQGLHLKIIQIFCRKSVTCAALVGLVDYVVENDLQDQDTNENKQRNGEVPGTSEPYQKVTETLRKGRLAGQLHKMKFTKLLTKLCSWTKMLFVLYIQIPKRQWKMRTKGMMLSTLSLRASSKELGIWLNLMKTNLK
jgi:hypothetical protein